MGNTATNTTKKAYMCASAISGSYGLSDRWMARLGEPDKTAYNYNHAGGRDKKLYLVARVEAFLEAHADEYAAAQQERAKRSAAARGASERAAAAQVEWARTVPITHEPWPSDLDAACREHLAGIGMPGAAPNERHILNMLRHVYTDYHGLLRQNAGRVGCWQAYSVVKERVNAEITERLAGAALRGDASSPDARIGEDS